MLAVLTGAAATYAFLARAPQEQNKAQAQIDCRKSALELYALTREENETCEINGRAVPEIHFDETTHRCYYETFAQCTGAAFREVHDGYTGALIIEYSFYPNGFSDPHSLSIDDYNAKKRALGFPD